MNESNKKKIKFENDEYLFDSLPEEAKNLILGLRTAENQLRMHQDALQLIGISKNKMVEDLKKILENIEPIKNE